MPSGFVYRKGPHQFKNKGSTASTAIAPGDALKSGSGLVLPLTTDTKCEGVSMATKLVGDSATTQVQILKCITGRTIFQAWEKRGSGSLATTNEDQIVDISGASGAMGFDSSVAGVEGDVYLETVLKAGAINVGTAMVAFADPAWASST